jgi:hypothetical protein
VLLRISIIKRGRGKEDNEIFFGEIKTPKVRVGIKLPIPPSLANLPPAYGL